MTGSTITTTTTTTITTRRDGTQVTKRKVSRSKTPDQRLPSRSRSFGSTNNNNNNNSTRSRSRSKSVTRPSLTEALGLLGATGHVDNTDFLVAVQRAIPAEFVLIASQDNVTQAQEDYFALEHYQLPAIPRHSGSGGRGSATNGAGSVATCALLEFLYEHPSWWVASSSSSGQGSCSVLEILQEIKQRVRRNSKLEAKPTLSSSRPVGPPTFEGPSRLAPFFIVPPGFTGTRRALLIGVRSGTGRGPKKLKGTANDLALMGGFLQRHCGFSPEHIHQLYEDDDKSGSDETQPTRRNILKAFQNMVTLCQPRDVLFIQYSGHGGRTGNNLFIIPSDFATAGEIKDEIILRDLIKALPARSHTTMLVDCCYSGTVGDLPYILQDSSTSSSKAPQQQIEHFFDTDTRQEVLKKEANNDTEYWELRQARAEKRVYDRITLPGKRLAEAAASAGATATQVMQDMGQGLSQAATSASDAGAAAFEALNSSLSALSMDGSFSALSLDGSFSGSTGERKPPKRSTSSKKKSGHNESLSSFFSKNNKKEARTGSVGGGGSVTSGVSRTSESHRSMGANSSTVEAMNSSLSNFMGKAAQARQRMASMRSDNRSVDDSSTLDGSMDWSARKKNTGHRMIPRTRSSDGNNSVGGGGQAAPSSIRRGGKRPVTRSHTHSGPTGGLADAASKAKIALAEAQARKEAVERSRKEAEAAREAARKNRA